VQFYLHYPELTILWKGLCNLLEGVILIYAP